MEQPRAENVRIMKPIAIIIPGKPVAKARPRFARRGEFTVTYKTDKETAEEGKFVLLARETMAKAGHQGPIPRGTPVKITCAFMFEIPASFSKKRRKALNGQLHTKKPDLDNCIKFVKDALNRIAWEDDSQVCVYGPCVKRYAEIPGTLIIIETLDGEPQKLE